VIWCVNTLRTLRSNKSDTLPLSSSLVLSRSLALAFASLFISSSFVKENMSVIIFNKTLGVERFIKDRTRIEQPKLNLVTVDHDSSFPCLLVGMYVYVNMSVIIFNKTLGVESLLYRGVY